MEWFWKIIPPAIFSSFTVGLILGLIAAFFAWKNGLSRLRAIKKEIKRSDDEARDLQKHLNTQLKINASGNEVVQKELEQLKQQNETLRINLASLQQKPDRMTAKQLRINQEAISALCEQAPGFASAWEQARRKAETHAEEADKGLRKIIDLIIPQKTQSNKTLPPPKKEDEETKA